MIQQDQVKAAAEGGGLQERGIEACSSLSTTLKNHQRHQWAYDTVEVQKCFSLCSLSFYYYLCAERHWTCSI
jgi:hypothetical protein